MFFKTNEIIKTLLIAFIVSIYVPNAFAFPAFTESEINQAEKKRNNKLNAEIEKYQNQATIFMGEIIDSGGAVIESGDNYCSDQVQEKWRGFLASDYYSKAANFLTNLINELKQLYRGSQKELKPVTKYVGKEWKGLKKDLNIKSNNGQNDIWKSIDTQIKDTKTQLRNL